MKKSLLSLSLVTLVTGTFLSSCSGVVKYEDGVIVKIGDTKYTIEEAYKEFSGYKEKDSDSNYTISEEGAKNYYTLLKNILIQLADLYHTSTDYLLGRTNDIRPPKPCIPQKK